MNNSFGEARHLQHFKQIEVGKQTINGTIHARKAIDELDLVPHCNRCYPSPLALSNGINY